MIRKKFVLLLLFLLTGTFVPVGNAIAQKNERPRQFKNLPAQERRQSVEKFRQEQPGNPGQFQGPEKIQQRRDEIRSRPVERDRQPDTNRDGALSREEMKKSRPGLAKHFDEIDASHRGAVSQEEIRAFREKRRQQRLERGNGDPRF